MKFFITVKRLLITVVGSCLLLATGTHLAQAQTPTLGEALNTTTTPNLIWTNPGDYVYIGGEGTTNSNNPWFLEQEQTHDGTWAAQSGQYADWYYNESAINASVVGPGTLSFWCKTNGNLDFDIDDWVIETPPDSGDWQRFTYQIPAGQHALRWVYYGGDAGYLDEVSFTADLPQALGNQGLRLVSGEDGTSSWTAQSATAHEAAFAAQSGTASDDGASTLKTTISGPGALSFWWKVSSEEGYDFLRFYIDGAEQSGAISGEADWQQCSFQIPTGSHEIKWVYAKDESESAGADCGWVAEVAYDVPLDQALNSSGISWATPTDGHAWPWFSQSEFTHDGQCAAQSGPSARVYNNSPGYCTSALEATVTGPGPLTFWWAVSCAPAQSGNCCSFSIDGTAQDSISGEVGWQQKSYSISAGEHTLTWSYQQHPGSINGTDCAWLDQVVFGMPGTPASPIANPISSNEICLTWNAVANAGGYRIERSTSGVAPWTVVTTTSLSADTTSYVDHGRSEGTKYYYRIYATNGGSDSSPATVSCTSLPNPPDSLTINDISTTQTARVRISWTDRSARETGFLLERSPNGVDSWTAIPIGPSSGTGQTVTYEDTDDVALENHYWYRVRATMTGQ